MFGKAVGAANPGIPALSRSTVGTCSGKLVFETAASLSALFKRTGDIAQCGDELEIQKGRKL
jgi:hypothetical protein